MSYFYKDDGELKTVNAVVIAVIVGVIGVSFLAYTMPIYAVWQQGLSGKAELSKASYNRQIAVQEALAKKESAQSLAEAEITRAGGVAKANQIISESITPNYLRYKWIEGMQTNQMQVVYVPTEANLPIMEAGKRGNWGDKETT